MSPLFDWLFAPYESVPFHFIWVEVISVAFALLSVWFSKRENILVYPFGMISTLLTAWLLWQYNLLGDMVINGYYFLMSAFGWWFWTRKTDKHTFIPISKTTIPEWKIALFIFHTSCMFIVLIYHFSGRFEQWISYVDVFTSGIFFVGMWLMAKKKLEHWLVLLLGNIFSVPLYLIKGLNLYVVLFIVYIFISIWGYQAWKKKVEKPPTSLFE